jgi:hypothetical protein
MGSASPASFEPLIDTMGRHQTAEMAGMVYHPRAAVPVMACRQPALPAAGERQGDHAHDDRACQLATPTVIAVMLALWSPWAFEMSTQLL